MTSSREIAYDLLRRVMAGERENVPMYLAMLLERSSTLRNSDTHYNQILPPELTSARISSEDVADIVSELCAAIRRNPDESLIAAVSTVGSREVTECVLQVLLGPPRQLTQQEYGQIVGILAAYLPGLLNRDPGLMSDVQASSLRRELEKFEEGSDAALKRHASQLLRGL